MDLSREGDEHSSPFLCPLAPWEMGLFPLTGPWKNRRCNGAMSTEERAWNGLL